MSEYIELLIPDHAYVAARNAFIHKAEAKANQNFGKACKSPGDRKALERYAAGWNKCFHREMDRLVTAAGIKSQ